MTREIKKPRGFRVWYTLGKRWLPPDVFKLNADGSISTYGLYAAKNDLVRCDSTGLHDKNGKEIFEGDIVDDGNLLRGVITWLPDAAAFAIDGLLLSNQYIGMKVIEVIGNLYSSPELLEVKR